MLYLVTGGAGFIGCNFVRQLLASGRGCSRQALTRHPPGASTLRCDRLPGW
jgi:nucleoside-diphosphate-sugar epimerase